MNKLDINGKVFKITNDHVYEGIRKDGGGCPLALALRDFLCCDTDLKDDSNLDYLEINVDFKTVSIEYLAVNGDTYTWECDVVLDDAITDFIHDFDNERIAYRQFMGRTVHVELLEDKHYKLSFI